ncbi:MAG: YeeE/YedE family protein [Rhodospirillales bacterium]
MRILAALIAGLLFGAGLSLSRMIDPSVVLAFLDFGSIPEGGWNPALALVMAGALLVAAPGYALIFRRSRPLLAPAYGIPTKRAIDARLIVGAAMFGLGWGLVGYCPGPAIAGLGFGPGKTWLFVAAMLLGMGLYHLMVERRPPGDERRPTLVSDDAGS